MAHATTDDDERRDLEARLYADHAAHVVWLSTPEDSAALRSAVERAFASGWMASQRHAFRR